MVNATIVLGVNDNIAVCINTRITRRVHNYWIHQQLEMSSLIQYFRKMQIIQAK